MNQTLEPAAVMKRVPAASPMKEWPCMRTAKLGDQDITLVGLTDKVLVPAILSDTPDIERILQDSEILLTSGSDVVTDYPWIVGSTDRDIFGKPRTDSVSHQHGAWDLSPMYNHDYIISPSASIYGLAWNVLSLALLSTMSDRSVAFIVEGDHLHVTRSIAPNLLPQGSVIAVPTITAWYSVFEAIRRADAVVGPLFDVTVWRIFHKDTMSYNPLERSAFLDAGYLTQPGTKTPVAPTSE